MVTAEEKLLPRLVPTGLTRGEKKWKHGIYNFRTITCKPGYFIAGDTNLRSVVLIGNAPFPGCISKLSFCISSYSIYRSHVRRLILVY